MKTDRIHRIKSMEVLLDQVLEADSFEQVEAQLGILRSYYFGPLWKEDFAADEQGLIPADLKRGVLSEDTLYNLLTDWLTCLKQKAEVDLRYIYNQLKDKYPLTFTSTFALDEGFTEDMPIICGKTGDKTFRLYWDDPDFVFSYETPERKNHGHPQDTSEAIALIESFFAENEP